MAKSGNFEVANSSFLLLVDVWPIPESSCQIL